MKLHIKQIPENARVLPILPWQQIKNIKAINVDPDTDLINKITGAPLWIWEMAKTCYQEDGIGLAAPQVGIYKKVMICRDLDLDNTTQKVLPTFQVYINPSFKPEMEKGKSVDKEYCLSVPEKAYDITRWNSIIISWTEISSENILVEKSQAISGFQARLTQHEFDHLNGVSIPQRYQLQHKPKTKKKKRRK